MAEGMSKIEAERLDVVMLHERIVDLRRRVKATGSLVDEYRSALAPGVGDPPPIRVDPGNAAAVTKCLDSPRID